MKRWRLDSEEFGYTPRISVFLKFLNTIAGTGVAFSVMHVFFSYMSFDKTPSEVTGEVPRFFDEAEARYYLILLLMFFLTAVVSGVFRLMPALAVLPATMTTTYVLLLFDADVLTAGPMTFLLFSLFLVAGYSYIALCGDGKWTNLLFRSVIALVGIIASVWAFKVYLAAPGAADSLRECLVPNVELDGLSAVWRYERLQALTNAVSLGNRGYYLVASLLGLLLSTLLMLLPQFKLLLTVFSIGFVGFLSYIVTFGRLTYYPMFFAVPLMILSIGCLMHVTAGKREMSGSIVQDEIETNKKNGF